jgi:hypothetical protein
VGQQYNERIELERVRLSNGDGRHGDELLLVENGTVEFPEVTDGCLMHLCDGYGQRL